MTLEELLTRVQARRGVQEAAIGRGLPIDLDVALAADPQLASLELQEAVLTAALEIQGALGGVASATFKARPIRARR